MGKLYSKKIPVLDCGHEYIRQVLYGRWKMVLLYYIAEGVSRPGALERKIPQATRRVLDVQLSQLLKHEVITKEIYSEAVPRVEYSLTELGKSLMPVISTMIAWGNEHKAQLKKVVNQH